MRKVICVGLLLFYLGSVQAETLVIESPAARVSLLELYTSEGCSSCPPADRWLTSLLDDDRLWEQVVPVAFHVDYWDYLGWKDRFARSDYSERQRNLARNGQLATVYTPGLVLNGAEWRSWFGLRRLTLEQPPSHPGPLTLELVDQRVRAQFKPLPGLKMPKLHIALLGFGLENDVRAGENHGRQLRHDFVVLGLETAQLLRTGESWVAEAVLPSSAEATERRALAAWISEAGNEVPIQALGAWL